MIIIKKIFTYIVVILLVTVSINFLVKSRTGNFLIIEIQRSYENQGDLSENFKENYKSKLSHINNVSNKEFILGYTDLNIYNNYEEAKTHFKEVLNKRDIYTSKFALLYSYGFMSELNMKNGNIKKAIENARDGFELLNPKDYTDYKVTLWNIFRPVLTTKEGRELALNSYNKIKEHENLLNKESKLYLYKSLSNLNILAYRYVYAIENNLELVVLASDMNRYADVNRATIDLGVLARQLGEYETASKIISYCDNQKIKNVEERADLEIYKYINLAEIEIILKNYTKANEYINNIDKYEKYVIPEKLDDIRALKYIIKSRIYTENNNLKESRKWINKAKGILDKDKVVFYIDKNTEYYIALGELEFKEHNLSKSEESFKRALKLAEDTQNGECIEKSLKSLYNIYGTRGDLTYQREYGMKIVEFKDVVNKHFAKTYYKNAIYKYKEGIANKENKNIKARNLLLWILIIILITILFLFNIYPRIVNMLNKSKIRKYLIGDKYILNYQPIVNPKNNNIVGFEALIRLKLKNKIFMPNNIIKDMEKSNMLGEVSLWILNKILEDYKEISEIKDVIDGFYISMNISLKEIENEYIIVNLIEKLRNSGIEEKSICIEITEDTYYQSQIRVKNNIEKLRKAGFLIALDDLGVEYSNVAILEKFKFDIIKLDKYFIDGITNSDIKRTVIDTADYLSYTKNKTIVVEGVEERPQMEIIRNTVSNKMYIQGYFYSKPLILSELKTLKIKKA
ncbi:EAL domain-containing protein [Paraclostridium sordellii]|uniref:EAL domain-containing protein n=1 Tax=Paraclostridium sordellii TaxID=1505 RepID=UPI0005E29231|nr:EAL domain-containing protein [Paeniclostridium sordellii]CEN92832.1 diguanylate phosphodiesterase [[Clostridium] sordellii] [Paeniclostridium sordellii]CEN96262.1 diguanylate phosphodiesterase [[Clostridium] sordellii] [Paeniclostridium sordellii]